MDYQAGLAIVPNDVDLIVSLSNVKMRAGLFQEAYDDLSRALKIEPRNARSLRMFAQLHEGMGRQAKALELYSAALKIKSDEPYALLARSEIFAQLGKYPDALRDADTLVAIAPEIINKIGYVGPTAQVEDFHAKALNHRALVHRTFGHNEMASNDLNAAVDYKRTASSLSARGSHLLIMNKDVEAAADLIEASSLDPQDPAIQYSLGLIFLKQGKISDSLAAFSKSIDLDPSDSDAYMARSKILRMFSRFDEAQQDVYRAIQIEPDKLNRVVRGMHRAGLWPYSFVPEVSSAAFRTTLADCMRKPNCQ